MVNPNRGDVEILLDGRPHTLRYTLNALAELAERLEIERLSDFENLGELGVGELRFLLWLGLKKHHPELSEAQVGDMDMDLAEVGTKIGEAFSASLAGSRTFAVEAPAGDEGDTKKK